MKVSDKIIELYKQGHIRDSVMNHAIKQAAAAKATKNFIKRASLIKRRAEVFGIVTPSMMKLAKDISVTPLQERATGPLAKALLGLAGLSVLSDIGHRLANSYHQSQAYNQMMEENPEFQGKEDLVKKHFEVLKQFSPALAANPTVAAGHIRQAIEMGDIIPTDTVKNLAQTQKAYRESRGTTLAGLPGDVISSLTGSLGNILTAAGGAALG